MLLCKSAKVRGTCRVAGGGRGRGATVSRPGVRVFEVAICDLKRDSGGRVADASLPRGEEVRELSEAGAAEGFEVIDFAERRAGKPEAATLSEFAQALRVGLGLCE